jgi:putative FmdB family regulatory protein
MPLYEYQCDACGHRFEVIQKYSDSPIETCEKCGGAVRKLFSSPAIQFKGSGWYITDYARAGKSDSATTTAGKSDSAASSGDAKSESKSESKTETKTESKPTTPSTSS